MARFMSWDLKSSNFGAKKNGSNFGCPLPTIGIVSDPLPSVRSKTCQLVYTLPTGPAPPPAWTSCNKLHSRSKHVEGMGLSFG